MKVDTEDRDINGAFEKYIEKINTIYDRTNKPTYAVLISKVEYSSSDFNCIYEVNGYKIYNSQT